MKVGVIKTFLQNTNQALNPLFLIYEMPSPYGKAKSLRGPNPSRATQYNI